MAGDRVRAPRAPCVNESSTRPETRAREPRCRSHEQAEGARSSDAGRRAAAARRPLGLHARADGGARRRAPEDRGRTRAPRTRLPRREQRDDAAGGEAGRLGEARHRRKARARAEGGVRGHHEARAGGGAPGGASPKSSMKRDSSSGLSRSAGGPPAPILGASAKAVRARADATASRQIPPITCPANWDDGFLTPSRLEGIARSARPSARAGG